MLADVNLPHRLWVPGPEEQAGLCEVSRVAPERVVELLGGPRKQPVPHSCALDSLAPPTESRPQEADVTSHSLAFCVIEKTDWSMKTFGEEGQPWDKGEEKVTPGLGGNPSHRQEDDSASCSVQAKIHHPPLGLCMFSAASHPTPAYLLCGVSSFLPHPSSLLSDRILEQELVLKDHVLFPVLKDESKCQRTVFSNCPQILIFDIWERESRILGDTQDFLKV